MITSTKLHVPIVTLSINDNIKYLKDKYKSEITTQTKNNNLDYLI